MEVVVSIADITTLDGCFQLIHEAIRLGPVEGIFNLALKLRDGIFENQTTCKFSECCEVKATSTKHLDEVSRRLCPNLKHFIVFSSITCGIGNPGLSNYGMANSVMEMIMEKRRESNLPGKAIQVPIYI